MANMPANGTAAPRCAALVGPYLSGKTTLLEALLFAAGTTSRRGSVRDGNSVGDHAARGARPADVDRDQRRRAPAFSAIRGRSSIAPARSSCL